MRVTIAGARSGELTALSRVLGQVPAALAWIATGPASLATRCREDRPDVLIAAAPGTFDALASIGGSANTRGLTIVVVVDDREKRVHEIYTAMERGASDVARMPALRADGTVDDPDRLVAKLARFGRRSTIAPAATEAPIVLVGASTGGPDALARVLGGLTPTARARVLLVQHIDEPFTRGLADWLNARGGRHVATAAEGARLDPDTVLLVRSDAQATVDAGGRVRYQPFAAGQLYHPGIDPLFESCAKLRTPGIAALLTGMGEDGARGLLALRRAGWTTIAQDAASSFVFGMPAKAAALGAASRILPLDDIGAAVSRSLAQHAVVER